MPACEILNYSPDRDKGNLKRLLSRKHWEDTPPSLPSPSQLWGLHFPDPLLAVGDLGPSLKSLSIAGGVGGKELGPSQHLPVCPTPSWWMTAGSDRNSKVANVFFGQESGFFYALENQAWTIQMPLTTTVIAGWQAGKEPSALGRLLKGKDRNQDLLSTCVLSCLIST